MLLKLKQDSNKLLGILSMPLFPANLNC